MGLTTRKIDDHTIEVTKSSTVETIAGYELGALKRQRAAIQQQKDRDNAARDAELAEVDALISEAEKLGIIEAPAEAVK